MNIISNFPKENKDERGITDYIPVIAFTIACFLAMLALVWRVCQIPIEYEELIGEPIKETIEETPEEPIEEDLGQISVPEELIVGKIEEPTKVVHVYPTDDDLLAMVAMSEAGNQDILGMAFVVMTVLNRCEEYNLTVEEVLYAKGQYSFPYYGLVSHDAYRSVELAREYRDTFPKIMWFRTGTFHDIGKPAFKWGDHYFSAIEEEEG